MEMSSDEQITELLKDESFLRWQLFAAEADQEKWKKRIAEDPEKKAIAEQATVILRSFKMNDYRFSAAEKAILQEELHQKISLEKRRKHKRLICYSTVAASVLLIVAFAFVEIFSAKKENIAPSDQQLLMNDSLPRSQDIQLFLADREAVSFQQNADISYGQGGKVVARAKDQVLTSFQVDESVVQWNKLVVPKGKRSSVTLADGTKVWINAESILEFPSAFNDQGREIRVTGEIYIEVAKKDQLPFVVKTKDFDIKVLGTTFNVSTHEDDHFQYVVLVEGSLAVKSNLDDRPDVRLVPNQMLQISDAGNTVEAVNVYDYISWKDGVFQFRSEKLSSILARFSRYYNVPIRCHEAVKDRRCTGKLVLFESLDSVLNTISNSLPIAWEKDGNEITISESNP